MRLSITFFLFNHFNPTKMAAQESGHFTVANYG